MGKQDLESVQNEYNDWKLHRASGLPGGMDPFEVFSAELLLKDYGLSDADILSGIVGKSQDGGCDALFFLLSGKCVRREDPIPDQSGLTAHLIFMQAKQGSGFSPLQIDRFDALTDDLLDTTRKPSEYRRTYNERLLGIMGTIKRILPGLRAPRIVVDYYYVTMADAVPTEDCRRSASHVTETVVRHYNRADVHPFHYVNASQLYNWINLRPPFEKALKFAELIDGSEGHVGLVRLVELYAFLKGEDGELIERMFDDNVRGFQLDTKVNEAILDTLRASPGSKPEFWLLNNGITILSPRAERSGGKQFKIKDPQVVNGLQTSRQVFTFFKEAEWERQLGLRDNPNWEKENPDWREDARRILVRVIENSAEDSNEGFREEVIRATNNQNAMPAEALYTTFRIHKQIESYFLKSNLFYERRKGYWREKRKPIANTIPAVSLLQAILSIVLGKPDAARGRPRDYINDSEKRFSIFGHDEFDDSKSMSAEISQHRPYDLGVYLRCVQIVRKVEDFLSSPELVLDSVARRNLLYYLARWVVCAKIASAYSTPGAVLALDVDQLSEADLASGLKAVKRIYKRHGNNDEAAKSPQMGAALNAALKRKYSKRKAGSAKKDDKGKE